MAFGNTIRGTSAVFPNASGPHGGLPAPFNWAPVRWWPIQGLGNYSGMRLPPRLIAAARPTVAPQTSWLGAPLSPVDGTGDLWGHSWVLTPAVVGRFTVVLDRPFSTDKRGAIEAELERSGISTVGVAYGLSPTQLYWDVSPRESTVSSAEIQGYLRAAFANAGVPVSLVYTPAPARQSNPTAAYQDVLAGLGAIPESIARRFANLTADMLCSPVVQATATDDIARRYGEAQAQAFREHLRQATAYCRPGAVQREQQGADEAARRQSIWALGLVAAGAVVLGTIWYVGKPKRKPNRSNRRRRNPSEYEVGITSEFRYRASASERRLYGGSTVTQFLIEDPNFEEAARWHKVMGYGPTPGERRTDALLRYAHKIGVSHVVGKTKPKAMSKGA